MELLRLKCPLCHSSDIRYHSPYTTKGHGDRVMYKCEYFQAYFSETKKTLMEGLKTPVSVIWQVLKARTEGMGFFRHHPPPLVPESPLVWHYLCTHRHHTGNMIRPVATGAPHMRDTGVGCCARRRSVQGQVQGCQTCSPPSGT